MVNENYIEHHGILGQKWGIRRYQNKDGTLTNAGKKRLSSLESEYEKLTGKKVGSSTEKPASTSKKLQDMSDDELVAKTNRLRNEKNYIDAVNAMKSTQVSNVDKKKTSKIKPLVGDVLTSSVKNIGTQSVTYLMGVGANKIFEKFGFGPDAINPKKGQKDK